MNHKDKRVAYYLWYYPRLSQTFIQREVRALKKSGVPVEVIADGWDEAEILDEQTRALVDETTYLLPVAWPRLFRSLVRFCCMHPVKLAHSLFSIKSCRYQHHKSLTEDLRVFLKAVHLAGVLVEKKIAHAHCPWSDVNAFILLIASRLVGIPYSVQVRAHDVHRKTSTYALREKFQHAEFIITNCQYNEKHVRTFLTEQNWQKIQTIAEGLDLTQFQPNGFTKEVFPEVRLLTVARIIEQKGFVYLLKACKLLKDKNIPFRCEIIGAPEEPLYTDYYLMIKSLHKELELEKQVLFAGAQPFQNVLQAYQKASIFVLPCVLAQDGSRDMTPNSVMEAMAMKLPVITTPVTGLPEIIEDGISGILIPPRDEAALETAITGLISDRDRRRTLGENARKRIEERFDIQKNITGYVKLFEDSNDEYRRHRISETVS